MHVHPSLSPRLIQRLLRRLVRPLLGEFLDPRPASRLIRATARQEWKLLALHLGTTVVGALTEGVTLAVIFLAVEILSRPAGATWAANPLTSRVPLLPGLLEALPRTPLFLIFLAVAVLMQAIQGLMSYLSGVSLGDFSARCRSSITALIHRQILDFSYACASRYRVGDLLNHAANGPAAVQGQIELTGQLLIQGLLIALYSLVLVSLSPWLVLVAVGLAAAIVLVQRVLLPRIRRGSHRLTMIEVEISSRVTEDIQGLRLLHSAGRLDAADHALRARMGELEAVMRRQNRLSQVVGPFSAFLPIAAIAVLGAVSLLAFGSRNTGVLPSLVTFVLALQRLNVRLGGMAGTFTSLSRNAAELDRLNEILKPDGKDFRRRGGVRFHGLQREIRFEAVGLRYNPDLAPALTDLELTIPKGRTVALVGASGAGKSSIADLLVGLYAPTCGRILIDGTDMADLDLSSWQQRLGVVSQDTFLFNDSLAANISFGCPEATQAAIEAAAALAQAAGFIEALPAGYDTLVGERGYLLSGGQRQRISLARAILRNPELLILDEATSALDSQSERLVQQAIEQFERQHTVLVIAHRLSTIVNADQILVIEQGRIVERGKHVELLGKGSLYAVLWQQQVGVARHNNSMIV
ncbi:ABC transporter ATP-binding protein [Synechococcus sp. 1G10]|uniref:ABC transporter ATP-binding protein n=1 Tax=Synechococcus sp. 1G10 TaxID=2025605 RepID=UPI001E42D242|nr:ABC transporter ATP-binding protein [Synechococcus sp. 1G10]